MVTPVVDYALTRAEIDPDRLVLLGYSLGGYLTARAAAHEHRLAALTLDDGLYNYYDAHTQAMPPLLREWVETGQDDLANPVASLLMKGSTQLRWALRNGVWAFGATSVADYIRRTAERFAHSGRHHAAAARLRWRRTHAGGVGGAHTRPSAATRGPASSRGPGCDGDDSRGRPHRALRPCRDSQPLNATCHTRAMKVAGTGGRGRATLCLRPARCADRHGGRAQEHADLSSSTSSLDAGSCALTACPTTPGHADLRCSRPLATPARNSRSLHTVHTRARTLHRRHFS